MSDADDFDLLYRDHKGINANLGTLKYHDVFGEPDGTHSIDCVWRFSYCFFECWKRLVYFFLTITYAIWMSVWWGCEFACIAFLHVWILLPFMKKPETSTTMSGGDLDLVNRDPQGLNAHLGTLHFNDVIGEPDGIHSIDCIWRCSYSCFNCWKKLFYNILTLFYGICYAAYWGCEFAYIAFIHIWVISPCLKVLEINCGLCQRIYASCINCCCVPCFEAMGTVFHAFKK